MVHSVFLRYLKAHLLTLLILILMRLFAEIVGAVYEALARSAHVVAITIAGLNKGLIAMGAFESFLLSVRFLMFDHVTKFRRGYLTIDAAKKLVGPPRFVIHHVMLDKAKLAGIVAVAVPDAFFDGFVFVEHDLGDVKVASV